ncbi:MAG: histidine kinase [Acidobacteriota bacterium]
MGVIVLRLRDQVRDYHALRSRSQRLEAELLKKTIQPHLLMNTLLTIQSWFGQDPAKAGRLVEALADEFRIISRVAAQPEIDMADEIQLCRRHLELMGPRPRR